MTILRKIFISDSSGNSLSSDGAGSLLVLAALEDALGNAIDSDTFGRLLTQSMPWEHSRVHAGVFFNTGYYNAALAAAATIDILIIAGATKQMHTAFAAAAGGDATLELYEGTTVIANGAAITPFDANRSTANVTESSHYYGPTITAVGTKLGPTRFIPGGSGVFGTGGSDGGPIRDGTEIILAPATNYLVRLTNTSTGAYAASLEYGYYEN